MRMKGFVVLLLLSFLFSSSLMAQLYTLKNFNHKDGLDIPDIKAVTQTKDGYIWLGTQSNGLLQFDGKRFDEIGSKSLTEGQNITSLLTTIDDQVVFSTQTGGIFQYNSKGSKLLFKSSRPVGDYNKVFNFHSHLVFVCDKAIFIYKNGNIVKQLSTRSHRENIEITQYIEVPQGAILLGNTGSYFLSKEKKSIVPLHEFLRISDTQTKWMRYGVYADNTLSIFDEKLATKYEVSLASLGNVEPKSAFSCTSPLISTDRITGATIDQIHGQLICISEQGNLFQYKDQRFTALSSNHAEKLINCQYITTDLNGNIWLCSALKGLYKVSLEPFTKVEINPLYTNSLISLFFQASKGTVILGSESGKTGIASNLKGSFKEYNFVAYGACELNNTIYIATNQGLKAYYADNGKLTDLSLLELKEKTISFLFSDGATIWAGIKDEGMIRFDPQTGKTSIFRNLFSNFPKNFYTAQKTFDNRFILFGTNNGIVQFNLNTKTFRQIDDFPEALGNLSLTSTVDCFETRWFTLENGLVGFTKANRKRVIQDPKNFISTDFHTLNADKFGNLILGTNKGITVLNINKSGTVQKFQHFNSNTGFTGYETRIRAQFQKNELVYVGTTEGLYLINTEILNHLSKPFEPQLTSIQSKDNRGETQSDSYEFNFLVNNPQLNIVQYRYRLRGLTDEWSALTSKSSVVFSDLTDNTYTFEVQATLDGKAFSETASISVQISNPFWTSNLFIILMILVFASLNVYFLNRVKVFDTKTILSNKDNTIAAKLMPRIILFGAIINTIAHVVGAQIETSIPNHLFFTIATALLIFSLYFISLKVARGKKKHILQLLLVAGFTIAMMQNFVELYLSSLHPYFIILIAVTSSLIPFIFEKLKSSIIYSIAILLISCLCFVVLDEVLFNQFLFIIIIVLTVCLSIFTTYLRHDSISKLLFISGVINKGDVITIVLNASNRMIYVSENISRYLSTNYEELIDKKVSDLDRFLPPDLDSPIDSMNSFEDGKKYLNPVISVNNEVMWIEWSCKVFTRDVKVILGQDVTQKMELETTFELLVQNAEDFIYQCDAHGNFVFLNDQALTRTGYNAEDLIGQNSSVLVLDGHQSEVKTYYQQHFNTHRESSYHEFPIETKDGEIIWLGQHVTTLYELGSKNRIKGFLALARDITENRRQQQIILEQQRDITSSIHYAKRIQLNLLPTNSQLDKIFHESFLIYRPKDIVSGDFYWMDRINGFTIVALGDCTGHGVPGSFMTLLGINLLNSIVLEDKLTHPGEILDKLDEKLVYVLPRGEGENKVNDGMEITVCVFNHEKNELHFACAGSRFLLNKNGMYTICKGDYKHIGDNRDAEFRGYNSQTIQFNQDDSIILFTDGFQDQFGGDKNKKFNFKRILSILEENDTLSLQQQKELLENEFDQWIGSYEQTDDVSMIGLKGLR